MSNSIQQSREELRARLHAVRRREAQAAGLQGLLSWVSLLLLSGLLILVVESVVPMGPTGRTIVFWLIPLVFSVLFIWKVIPPFLVVAGIRKGPDDLEISGRLGKEFPEIRDHLLNALQLAADARNRSYYSSGFIDRAFEDAIAESSTSTFERAVDFRAVRRWGAAATGLSTVAILLILMFPSSLTGAAARIWNHGESHDIPPRFTFAVEPGNVEIVKGESVTVTVRVEGEQFGAISLRSKPAQQLDYERTDLSPDADGAFRHTFGSLKLTTDYFAEAEDVRSEEFRLTIVDRPVVTMLRLSVTPPRYSGLGPRQLDDHVGDVSALKGTGITFHIESTKPLAQAALVYADGKEEPLVVDGQNAGGSTRLVRETDYHLRLRDQDGLLNSDPVVYHLQIVQDREPHAVVELPGANLDVAGNEKLAMLFRFTDDYGFSRMRLGYRLVRSRYEQPAAEDSFVELVIPPDVRSEAVVPFVWDLQDLHLVPEDVVEYYAEVSDNDEVSGPKSGRSEKFTLRLPSLEEVIAGVDEKQEAGFEALREALEESKQAGKDLEELQQEIRKNQQEMSWDEKRKAEEILEKYRKIEERIDQAAETLDQMVREMQRNEMLSRETLEKYMELQQLIEQINSPELAEALKQLQESINQFDPEKMQDLLKNLSFSEEQFRKSLERTMDLLKRIQIEQKVDEAIRRTEELMKTQEELAKEAEELRQSGEEEKAAKAGEQQDDLGEQAESLEEMVKELQKMMEDFPSEMPLEEMEQALTQLDSSALDDRMKEIGEQMKAMRMNEAIAGQQQAMHDMGRFMEQLSEMREMLLRTMEQEIVNEMRKAHQELLELSRQEEQLKNETAAMARNSPLFREGAGQQMEVLRNLGRVAERLTDVARKSFGITPEMGKAIGDAMRLMSDAMQGLEERNATKASAEQEAAMAALNEAARQVQAGMNAMMQGGGQGLGMTGLMQRLQSLTSMQQGINKGTRHMGTLGQQQAAEISRLAGEQGAVRKSLEQLAREASATGEMSKLLGDLGRIAQDMREVQTDLAQGNVQPETIRKQDRILSRLLDSQRSMRERDYEKKRRAEAGQVHQREQIPTFDLTTQDGRDRLRRDLLRAMEQGYSPDYQRLIRLYFEKLESSAHPN